MLGGNIDIINIFFGTNTRLSFDPGFQFFGNNVVIFVDRDNRGRDIVFFFFVGGQILQIVGNMSSLIHFEIWGFQKTEGIDLGKRRQISDQADVGTFRRLDRANAAIMGRLYVADFKTSPLAGQTSRTGSRQPSFMFELRERILVVHELRKLGRREELFYHRHHRPWIDQLHRRQVENIQR